MAVELGKQNLHEVIDIVNVMCSMQANGVDTAIPFLRGAPGGGKTESIRSMAIANDDEFFSCHFALKQPEDLGGIPQFSNININGENILSTQWSIPEILEHLLRLSEKAKEKNKKVIFFLDDIHRCGPFHVTALFELLSERKIRDIHLPSNVAIVLAGNGSIKAGAQLMNSAIINRCSVMDVQTNFEHWKNDWAIPNGFNMHLLSFLRNQRYSKWFHAEEDINNPWPSPRSWTKLSNVLNYFLNDKKRKTSANKIEYICQAHVGPEAAKDFVAYYQIMSNFNVDKIFKNIEDQFKMRSIQDVINANIKLIQGYDELHQFALSNAILIEFTQATPKERKAKNLYDILSSLMIAFSMNPKSTFPEMTLAIMKELITFVIKDYSERLLIRKSYDTIAKEIEGCRTINEIIDDMISQRMDQKPIVKKEKKSKAAK